MPVEPRTRQLIFLMLWIIFTITFIAVGAGIGWPVNRLVILLAIIAGLAPAFGGHVLVGALITARDDRRLRRGQNVYQEDAHVDDAGFIHLSAADARVNKHEATLSDMLSDAGKVIVSAGRTDDEP